MIATEYDTLFTDPPVTALGQYKIPEIFRRHTGVTAELIYLIGGGFDKHNTAIPPCLFERRINNPGMGTADRIDAAEITPVLVQHNVFQDFYPIHTATFTKNILGACFSFQTV
jgi:hypothetical protein